MTTGWDDHGFWGLMRRLGRQFLLLLFWTFFRTRVKGLEHIPAKGGALLAPNHQSYLDGVLMTALIRRPVRFVMSRDVYSRWFVYPFARFTRSIPIEQTQSPRELLLSLREAQEEIKAGGLVCMFPEGQLTRNGQLLPFRRGVERIMRGLKAPIVPVAIDGAMDTALGVRGGKVRILKAFRFRRAPINVAIGEPIPADSPAYKLREEVCRLMGDAYDFRREDTAPLHREALRAMRRKPFSKNFGDHSTPGPVPTFRVLAAAAVLGRRLHPVWKDDEFAGILLPPSLGAFAVNMAALLAGKVPVNLNYTTSPKVLKEICGVAGIRVVLTSRAFLEKSNVKVPEDLKTVLLEDVREQATSGDKLWGMLAGLFWPAGALERALGRKEPARLDDLATLVFSSGSTGMPKGVMLSHWNVQSNVKGALQYIELEPNSRLLAILPFFHSFGYMAALWMPPITNLAVTYYPNPLDGRAIGAMVERDRITHLFATPSFLSTYIRRVEPGQFGSLTFVLTGAEKLRDSLSDAFERNFGLAPAEGYGCTETSPVVSLNGEDYREPGIFQAGQRRGTVGRPIPGVSLRVEDVETGEPCPPGKPGKLFVTGPNIMQGYYKDEERTKEAMRDGWYDTGDIAQVDEDGFLAITDRLARFTKMSGEMVPHGRIEEALQSLSGEDEQAFAVTGVEDERRGERLAVLYTVEEEEAKSILDRVGGEEGGLPSLWVPRWQNFVKVDEIPKLGSGKLDLKKVRQIAREALEDQNGNGNGNGD